MITCAKCGTRVGVTGPCKTCAKNRPIHGPGCFQIAIRKARFGHKDWIVWSDTQGSHAARSTIENLKAMIAAQPTSWTLISSDGVPMKGFDWLATNVLAQLENGWA